MRITRWLAAGFVLALCATQARAEDKNKGFVDKVFKGEALAIEAFETRVLVGRHPDDPDRLKSAPVPSEIVEKFMQG